MNRSIIRYLLGQVLKIEAMLLLLPCIMAVVYQEKEGVAYLITAGVCGIVGGLGTIRKPKNTVFYLKEGCVTTALSWICLSFFGALPFLISGEIPSVTNALFETVSGFTTTGAVSYRMWKHSPTALIFGDVLHTGSVVWEYWYFYLPSFR